MKRTKCQKRFDEMEIIIDEYLNSNFTTKSREIMHKKMKWKSRRWLKDCIGYAIAMVFEKIDKEEK